MALHEAVIQRDVEAVRRLLLEEGADPFEHLRHPDSKSGESKSYANRTAVQIVDSKVRFDAARVEVLRQGPDYQRARYVGEATDELNAMIKIRDIFNEDHRRCREATLTKPARTGAAIGTARQLCSTGCGMTAKHQCSACGEAFYCSAKCQVNDWEKGHENSCAL